MDAAAKQLEQLNQEIADVTAEAKGAQDIWLGATDPQLKADLKEIWQQLQKDKEALIAERKALEAQLTGPGANFTEEDVLGLRSMYRRKAETLSMSGIKAEQWEIIKVTANLELKVWLGAINPVSKHQPKAFGWDDSLESSQSDRYLLFLKQELNSVLGRGMLSRIEVMDANRYPNCLSIRGLESIFGFNFNGKTDILLAHSQAVKSNMPEVATVAAIELKKGEFTRQHIAQACVTLIILNVKSPHLRPWVLLTDLNNRFSFFWMDGPTIYNSTQDASTGWRIIIDLLQRDASVTFAEPGQEAAVSVPILTRKAIPAELTRPRAVVSDVGNLSDVMDEDEARAYHLLNNLSVQPALAPFLPTRPPPEGMYA